MRNVTAVIGLMLLSGCTTVDTQWLETVDGNDIDVRNGVDWTGSRYVITENKLRTWNGNYQGGEEMVPARKKLFTDLAKKEMARVCHPHGYRMDCEGSFEMTERGSDHYLGGLVGLALSHIVAQYENIPREGKFSFVCLNEK